MLQERMRQWMGTVEPAKTSFNRVAKLVEDADVIITMNYTDTVERLYSGGSVELIHIHGRYSSRNGRLVVGSPEGERVTVRAITKNQI
ncbi:Uncharacterised protein [Arcanobacterium haemolyticum]|uniref:Uncharacterized protein n=2 Tax=Arcanobacterium haemolyticum TaxID=28264 RepID=D7BPR1_ARCHD|nr:hypothetical protein Arch_1200 [Arcanobacterium haemolyticum DSM 20595]SQH28339.1 Uncharacterised protein [Arcanobacterium haemolyticum]